MSFSHCKSETTPCSKLVWNSKDNFAPIASIVIPTYQRPQHLWGALQSALNQETSWPIEVIVVDNDPSSQASLLKFVQNTKMQHNLKYYINEENLSMYDNWNHAISLASGSYVSLLHDDDWLAKNFVDTMLPIALNGADLVVCRVRFGESGYIEKSISRWFDNSEVFPITRDDLVYGNPSPAPGYLINRSKLLKTGGFNADNYPAGDYETYAKFILKHGGVRIFKTCAYYRLNSGATLSPNTLQMILDQSIQIKKTLMQGNERRVGVTYVISLANILHFGRRNNIPLSLKCVHHLEALSNLLSKCSILLYLARGGRQLAKRMHRHIRKPAIRA